jgi:hypothetical protein
MSGPREKTLCHMAVSPRATVCKRLMQNTLRASVDRTTREPHILQAFSRGPADRALEPRVYGFGPLPHSPSRSIGG